MPDTPRDDAIERLEHDVEMLKKKVDALLKHSLEQMEALAFTLATIQVVQDALEEGAVLTDRPRRMSFTSLES